MIPLKFFTECLRTIVKELKFICEVGHGWDIWVRTFDIRAQAFAN